MRNRIVLITALVLVGLAAMYGSYRYWVYEEPRATGPLAEELLARFDPDDRGQILDDVIDAHIDPAALLVERRATLEANGFDCVIRPALVAGSEIISCRRPIEGRHYCDRINYYAYQTAAGEIIESLASTFRVADSDKIFGRCPYGPPPLEG